MSNIGYSMQIHLFNIVCKCFGNISWDNMFRQIIPNTQVSKTEIMFPYTSMTERYQ